MKRRTPLNHITTMMTSNKELSPAALAVLLYIGGVLRDCSRRPRPLGN